MACALFVVREGDKLRTQRYHKKRLLVSVQNPAGKAGAESTRLSAAAQ
jgi:hypothetical protein